MSDHSSTSFAGIEEAPMRRHSATDMHVHTSAGQTAVPASSPPRAVLSGWCPDTDTRDHVIARRNVLAGLWVGRLVGLTGSELADYAARMHAADFQVAGDADIIAVIREDLARAGLAFPERTIRQRLAVFHREALVQTHCTD
jgi:hypothetical protein